MPQRLPPQLVDFFKNTVRSIRLKGLRPVKKNVKQVFIEEMKQAYLD